MNMTVGGAVVSATDYVKAHPGSVAMMGVCLSQAAQGCSRAQALAAPVRVSSTYAQVDFPGVAQGRYTVRVVLLNSAGRTRLDATGTLHVVHHELSGCPSTANDSGSLKVQPDGSFG